MSADNYLLVTKGRGAFEGGFPVFHLFASDEDVDLARVVPEFIGVTLIDAMGWAHRWTRNNVCEYGVRTTEDVWDESHASAGRSSGEAAQATRERGY